MTQEDKELLLKDLCGRLPYGVQCEIGGCKYGPYTFGGADRDVSDLMAGRIFKPYLRPMDSMTEEEKEEYCNLQDKFLFSSQYPVTDAYELFDWLNSHHFDYRGLIERELAIAITEENNPYKE